MRQQKGQAAILIVFVLGMIALLIGVSLTKTGFGESMMARRTAGSTQAFFAANSGVEEAIYKIQKNNVYEGDFEIQVSEGSAKVKVVGTTDTKTIQSTGSYQNYIRKITTVVQNTSTKPGFENAIHAGNGGVELRNQTTVKGKGGVDGNVYSLSFIKGAKNDYTASSGECKNSASAIYGSAWAIDTITKLATNDSGVCVSKNATAGSLEYCFANGILSSPSEPLSSCISPNTWQSIPPAPEVPVVPLPEMGLNVVKSYLESKGEIFDGNCVLDGSGGINDCSKGTGTIGNLVITGDLVKPSNKNIKISGPVYVKGNVIFDSLGSVGLAPHITELSQIILTDGRITSSSNVAFGSNGNAFLLFISTHTPTESNICDFPSITLSSNTNSVLFYSTHGCVLVNANSNFFGAILGEAIRIDNNATVEYDPELQAAIFGLSDTGGWKILSFLEE